MLTKELDAERLVMDDQDARRFADRSGLKTVGTPGTLLAAKQRGEIASLRQEIERLLNLGFSCQPTAYRRSATKCGGVTSTLDNTSFPVLLTYSMSRRAERALRSNS